MKVVMYAHGGSKNHGCEAIVRSTTELLKNVTDRPILLSYQAEEDIQYEVHKIADVRQELQKIHKVSIDFFKAYARQKMSGDYHFMDALAHKKAIMNLPAVDMAFFIGGDNYCYSDVKSYKTINDYMQKKTKKMVLWGTSVEPGLLEDTEIRKDIKRFDCIVARESISYNALKKVNPNTILLPDPAFYLPFEKVELPQGFVKGKTIGINISPLLMKYEKFKGRLLENYETLIEYIIKETDNSIALIPHVVWDSNDDRRPLKYLYNKYKESGRVVLIPDHNCMQQKFIISQCRMFVGARTHATIAAYSAGVPTVAVGYSVKARGIARDLFGTEEEYVLPVQRLSDKKELEKAFQWMSENESSIRQTLEHKRREYKEYRVNYEKGILNVS